MKISREGMALLRLHLVPGMGPLRIGALLEAFGSAAAAWEAGPEAWKGAVESLPRPVIEAAAGVDRARVQGELQRLAALGGWVLTRDHEAYPYLLRQTPRAPAVLFGLGRWPRGLMLAIVGTRRPTPTGRRVAARLAGALAEKGAVIVSGMAKGIDAAAHEGCLEAGGITVAVVAHGLDRCYPAGHRALMRKIAERGAVITEFPLGTTLVPGLFPVRNRIVAGLCRGTLVVEAGLQSGAMGTADMAGDMGREVFAVPGDVRLWASKGPHQLIRDGAGLVETADDVWFALRFHTYTPEEQGPPVFCWPEGDKPKGARRRGGGAGSPRAGHPDAGPPAASSPKVGPLEDVPSTAGPPKGGGPQGSSPAPGRPDGPGHSSGGPEGRLLAVLAGGGWVGTDCLVEGGGGDTAGTLALLTRWELAGRIESDGHGRWRLRNPAVQAFGLQRDRGPI